MRMEGFSPAAIWSMVLGGASALILLANAVEKIVQAIKVARAPNRRQDDRLSALESWKVEVDKKLTNDKEHLDGIDKDNRISQRALLALLEHGIDGNNIKQMQDVKEALQNHLINR